MDVAEQSTHKGDSNLQVDSSVPSPEPANPSQSEERYREYFENAKDAIYVHDLTGRYPAIKGHLLDEGGELNRFVNVYVNNEDVRLGNGLDTSVDSESTVIVLPAMAGGSPT